MEKSKKPLYKHWWFWVLVFLFLLIMGNLNTGKKTPAEDPAPVENEAAAEASEDTLEDKIKASFKNHYSDLQVTESADSVKLSLHYDDTAWDETRLISDCLTDYVNLCQMLYPLGEVSKIEFYVFCDFTDSKGNESSEKAFAICMPKDKFDTYNWDNIKFTEGSYDQIESDCEYIDIHAGLKKNVDFNKVYYKG